MGIVHRRRGTEFDWEGVEVEAYADGATKRVLVGEREGAPFFRIRYFEVPPGGCTSLDHHVHDHGVVILRGRARVRLGDRWEEVSEGDVVYIPSWEVHQFEALGPEPLGFLCVIARKELWEQEEG